MIIRKVETKKELLDAKKVRRAVFVEEQGIDAEIEGSKDDECDHFVAYENNQPVGAGRIRYPEKNVAKIERMAVLKKILGDVSHSLSTLAITYIGIIYSTPKPTSRQRRINSGGLWGNCVLILAYFEGLKSF